MDIDAHILNLGDKQLPEFLYRIIPLQRFIQGCKASENVLVSPSSWTDPYEAAQLRTQLEHPLFVDRNGKHSSGLRDHTPRKVGGSWRTSTSAAKNAYCQCWSNLPESEAMWRLYSPDSMGVKLRVKARDLLSSLHRATSYEKVFLGAVEYLPQPEFDRIIRDAKQNHLIQLRPNLLDKLPGDSWARCLLRKRQQFAHESEFRLILARTFPESQPDPPALLRYAFAFNTLVSEVELDPRCSTFEATERAIRDAGFDGSVQRSNLYQPPNLHVRVSWPENEGWTVGGERKWNELRTPAHPSSVDDEPTGA